MLTTYVEQMERCGRRREAVEEAHKPALCERRVRDGRRQTGDAQPMLRSRSKHHKVVAHQPAVHRNLKGPAAPSEGPRGAHGHPLFAKAKAGMAAQFGGARRRAVGFEVCGAGNHPVGRGAEQPRDQRRVGERAGTDGHIEAVTAGAAGVSFGAPFVANPDLVARLAADAALAKPNPATYYGGGDTGYIDYPVLAEAPAAAPGYWQVTARVTDPAGFGRYTAVAGPVLASFGGQPIARGDRFEALEGSAAGRPYLVRFPSYAAARACFHSAAYQEAIALRAETASFDIVVVEGMPA